ncbi:VOC family protein [Nocardioides sp.]|uniref:VOC family protein n=1 Tax=Nocardioides sp. TaxID=35761 RepID=UPI00286D35C8|nr:VOC family protein [Nocardioides sp.]
MTSRISHTTIDCADAYALSEWWKPVLGFVDLHGDPNLPGDEECMIRDPVTLQSLLLVEVSEVKSAKNRLHLDLCPREGTRDQELVRLQAHGATVVADERGRYGPDTAWVVLADPEGNEFCLLRSPAEVDLGPPLPAQP